MQKCITNSDNGIINRLKLLLRTVSSIFKSAPLVFCVVLISELLIGLLQTLILIAWQHVVNNVEKYILKQTSLEILLLSLAISLLIFIFMDLFRMVLESFYTLLNSKTSERLEEQLYDKCKKINVVYFENSDLYNQISEFFTMYVKSRSNLSHFYFKSVLEDESYIIFGIYHHFLHQTAPKSLIKFFYQSTMLFQCPDESLE